MTRPAHGFTLAEAYELIQRTWGDESSEAGSEPNDGDSARVASAGDDDERCADAAAA